MKKRSTNQRLRQRLLTHRKRMQDELDAQRKLETIAHNAKVARNPPKSRKGTRKRVSPRDNVPAQ